MKTGKLVLVAVLLAFSLGYSYNEGSGLEEIKGLEDNLALS